MAKKKTASRSTPPWKKPNPNSKPTHLSEGDKDEAKARAKRAGRTYPNLVDNMRQAAKKKKKTGGSR